MLKSNKNMVSKSSTVQVREKYIKVEFHGDASRRLEDAFRRFMHPGDNETQGKTF